MLAREYWSLLAIRRIACGLILIGRAEGGREQLGFHRENGSSPKVEAAGHKQFLLLSGTARWGEDHLDGHSSSGG